jgi:hypothetical protein
LFPSECLAYRKKELKVADILRLATAGTRQLIGRNIRITLQQFAQRSLKTYEAWRIDTVGQVQPDRPNGSLVPDAEAGCVDHVVEVLEIPLAHAKGEAAEVPEDISHIVENDAVDVLAE